MPTERTKWNLLRLHGDHEKYGEQPSTKRDSQPSNGSNEDNENNVATDGQDAKNVRGGDK